KSWTFGSRFSHRSRTSFPARLSLTRISSRSRVICWSMVVSLPVSCSAVFMMRASWWWRRPSNSKIALHSGIDGARRNLFAGLLAALVELRLDFVDFVAHAVVELFDALVSAFRFVDVFVAPGDVFTIGSTVDPRLNVFDRRFARSSARDHADARQGLPPSLGHTATSLREPCQARPVLRRGVP